MNKEQEIKYIERLLRCFFEGITTNAEERTLYQFFQGKDIPDHLQEYKPLFSYFSKEMVKELKNLDGPGVDVALPVRKRRRIWIAVAASVVLLIAGTPLLLNSREPFNPYEGSYIVRNGIRITDLNKIQKELKVTIQETKEKKQEAEKLLKEIDESVKKINELEEKLQVYKTEFLDKYPEGYVRNEVSEILEKE